MKGCLPCTALVSDPQTPVTFMRTSASRGPGSGRSTRVTVTWLRSATMRRIGGLAVIRLLPSIRLGGASSAAAREAAADPVRQVAVGGRLGHGVRLKNGGSHRHACTVDEHEAVRVTGHADGMRLPSGLVHR